MKVFFVSTVHWFFSPWKLSKCGKVIKHWAENISQFPSRYEWHQTVSTYWQSWPGRCIWCIAARRSRRWTRLLRPSGQWRYHEKQYRAHPEWLEGWVLYEGENGQTLSVKEEDKKKGFPFLFPLDAFQHTCDCFYIFIQTVKLNTILSLECPTWERWAVLRVPYCMQHRCSNSNEWLLWEKKTSMLETYTALWL